MSLFLISCFTHLPIFFGGGKNPRVSVIPQNHRHANSVPQDNGKWATAPWPNPLGKPSHRPTVDCRKAGFLVPGVFKGETTRKAFIKHHAWFLVAFVFFNFHLLWMVTSICCFFLTFTFVGGYQHLLFLNFHVYMPFMKLTGCRWK